VSDDTFSLDDFQGATRLFPLPNLVVFPHVVQTLHIFESRYVEMVEDAVANDSLVAMAMLLPGWEGQYEGRPPADPFVCLSRILRHSPTKDNRYNILLAGIARARVVTELPAKRSYREVEVEILQDVEPATGDPAVRELHHELVRSFRKFIPDEMSTQEQLGDILDQQSQLGTLTDLISFSLPLELAFRQTLLSELDVMQRTRLLLDQLSQNELAASEQRPFPPEFSDN
jgi:Lon protease-like protein